ncbi:MAG: site-specific integrase [Methanobacteriota archaeon]
MRSLLRYHGVILPRRIKVTNSTATPTIENEQIPTQEELARVLRRAKPRSKTAVSFMAFADLRPEVLGNFNGSDGLVIGDLPELKVEGGKVAFEKAPTMVMVRSPLSKARHKYFTFLPVEGCTYLKEYLEERLRAGEVLGLDSPVIAHLKPATKRFMATRKITDEIRVHMRAAGVRKRPYVLRAYAETQLIIAESKGKISHPYLQFVAGHKGDIEARYSTNKGRLPPDMIEGIREAYRLCEPFLGTIAQPPGRESVVQEAKMEAMRTIAKNLFGMDLAEAKSTRELAEKKELTETEEIRLYEEEIEREKHKREDQLVNLLFDDPEFVETVRRKLQGLAKTGKA